MASKVIASLVALIGADTSGFESGLGRVQTGLGAVVTGLGGIALAGALAFGSGQVVGQAAEFESTLKNIQSVTGQTGAEIQGLSEDLLSIGANSVAGPQAIAAAYYDIAGGVADASVRMGTLQAAQALSEAGQADLGASTKGLISVMNAYGFSADQAMFAADVFTKTVGMGVGTMDEFVGAMSPLSGLASTAGVDFDRLGAMMAYMTTKGTSASQSATQIKAAMVALLNPNEKMKAALKAMGVESGSAALQMYGLEGTLGRLDIAMGGSTDAMAAAMGSTEALQAAVALNGAGYEEFLGTFQDTMGGVTDAARGVQLQAFNAQWSMLQNTLGAVATGVGLMVLPALTALAGGVRGMIGDIQQLGLSGALQKWFNAGVAWLRDTAPIIFRGALAAAVSFAQDAGAWLRTNGPDIAGGIIAWATGAFAWLRDNGPVIFRGALAAAVSFAQDAASWLKSNGPDIANGIRTWITNGLAWLRTEGPGVVQAALASVFGGGQGDILDTAFNDAMGMSATGSSLLGGLGDLGDMFNEWLSTGLSWVTTNVPPLVAEALKTGFQFASDVGAWLMTNGPDIGRGVGAWLGQALNTAVTQGAALVGNFFRSIFGVGGANPMEGMAGGDMAADAFGMGTAAQNMPGIMDTIASAITSILGGALTTIAGLVEGIFGMDKGSLINGVKGVFAVGGPFDTAIKAGIGFLQGLINKAIELGQKMVGALLSPFKTLLKAIALVAHYAGNAELANTAATAAVNIEKWEGGQGNANGGQDIEGWSMVGERGPEPAYFGSGGGRVVRSSRAQSVMGGTAIANFTVNNQIDGYTLMEQWIREAKRRNMQIEGLTV